MSASKLILPKSGPDRVTVLSPCHPADVKLALLIVVTKENHVELSGPVNDEDLCLMLLEKAKERIKNVHRGQNKFELVLPS